MSREYSKNKKIIEAGREVQAELDDTERNFLKANDEFLALGDRTKVKYLSIYKKYIEKDMSLTELAKKTGEPISTIKHALNMIGDQLVSFMRNKNIISHQVERIRYRKKKLIEDMEKLKIDTHKGKPTQQGVITAGTKIKYHQQLTSLEELENKLLGLLDTKPMIDQSRKTIIIKGGFGKKPDEKVINEQVTPS